MDAPPIKEQMEFIKTLLPTAKTIGVLYNPGDSGSVSSLETIREEAKAQGFTLVESTPFKSSDVQAAVLQLVGKVDAIYVPLDNMIVSAMKTVASLALKHNLPLFSADSGSVEAGAFACLGYSYLQTGRKTGEMVAEILNGKDPSEIAVASPGTIDIFINRHALEKLKIVLPESVRTQAHFLLRNGVFDVNLIQFMGALEVGFLYGLVAMGVLLSFRILDFPDLTVDGSLPLGAAVCAILIVSGVNPWLATVLCHFGGYGSRLYDSVDKRQVEYPSPSCQYFNDDGSLFD